MDHFVFPLILVDFNAFPLFLWTLLYEMQLCNPA
jgi:hypothetical protein